MLGLPPSGGVKGKFRRRRKARGQRGQGGGEAGRRVASGERGTGAHFRQDVDEVVQAGEVTVLPVPFLPRDVVLQGLALGQGRGLPEVDHPHLGLFLLVVDEEEGAANDLEGSREMRPGRARPHPDLPLLQTRLGKAGDLSVRWAEQHSGEAQSPRLHSPILSWAAEPRRVAMPRAEYTGSRTRPPSVNRARKECPGWQALCVCVHVRTWAWAPQQVRVL